VSTVGNGWAQRCVMLPILGSSICTRDDDMYVFSNKINKRE